MIKKLILPWLVLTGGSAFGAFTFALNNPVQVTFSGGIANPECVGGPACVIFNGTIMPDSVNDTFINGIMVTFDVTNPSSTALTENDNFFFAFTPGSLFHTDLPFTGDIFEIDLDPLAPLGAYTGTVTLLGDSEVPASCCDPSVLNPLNAPQTFEIDIAPEPSTWVLMLIGLSSVVFIARKRRTN